MSSLPRSSRSLLLPATVAAVAIGVAVLVQAEHQPAGLQNAGFEASAIGSAPTA